MAQNIHTITCQELHERIQESSSLVVINVLPEEMYQDCHIPGSINIPYDQIEASVQDWNRNLEMVVYCANDACDASRQAYETLEQIGFANIREFPGGMREWLQAGLPVEGPCTQDYLHE